MDFSELSETVQKLRRQYVDADLTLSYGVSPEPLWECRLAVDLMEPHGPRRPMLVIVQAHGATVDEAAAEAARRLQEVRQSH
jgi:hypothetical protein